MPLADSQDEETAEDMLPQSAPVPGKQASVSSSHGSSPIPPASPIQDQEQEQQEIGAVDQYKINGGGINGGGSIYRSTASSSTFGMNTPPFSTFSSSSPFNTFSSTSPFNSFPSTTASFNTFSSCASPFNSFSGSHHPHHHQANTLPVAPYGMGVGYPAPPPPPPPIFTTPDPMCPPGAASTSSLSLPVWNYPSFSGMGMCSGSSSSISKLSLDSPRYKLTPERAIPLIKWFEEHREHPYPTRHEKVLLCQTTQLTYTQVSTWFANARRRMKKVNSEEDENRSNHSSSDDCASQNSLDSPLHSS